MYSGRYMIEFPGQELPLQSQMGGFVVWDSESVVPD